MKLLKSCALAVSLAGTLFGTAQNSSTNGSSLTPAGHVHALIIVAEIDGMDNSHPNGNDPNGVWNYGSLPTWNKKLLSPTVADIGNEENLSLVYKQLSANSADPFLLTGDYYPEPVRVSSQSMSQVFDAIQNSTTGQNFDWSAYDNRTNVSGFTMSNVGTPADGKLDHVIVIWRKFGSSGGVASIGGTHTITTAGGTWTAQQGHQGLNFQSSGYDHIFEIVRHEDQHTIMGAGHYSGANNVVREHFYTSGGYGLMSQGFPAFFANAWEMWWRGWIDVNTVTTSNAYVILDDLVTGGGAIRIPIPNTTDQYLWIENHQRAQFADQKMFYEQYTQPETGIYMYVTTGGHDRSQTGIDGAHMKYYNGEGNYDYTDVGSLAVPGAGTQELFSKVSNPWSGQNNFQYIRYDVDGDGEILLNENWNAVAVTSSEEKMVWAERFGNSDVPTYAGTGNNSSALNMGDEVGLSGLFPITNTRTFSKADDKFDQALELNGISVKVISYNTITGAYNLNIQLEDTDVRNSTRWSGDINITDAVGSNGYSVNLKENVTVNIDKSGTPNRRFELTAGSGDFVTPSLITCLPNATFNMESNSNMIIDGGSTFTLSSGSSLSIGEGATVVVKAGSKLIVENNASINVAANGRLEIESGAEMIYQNTNASKGITLGNVNGGANTAEWRMRGDLRLQLNADLEFKGDGFLHLYSTSNINYGPNSHINLNGYSKYNTMLKLDNFTYLTANSLVDVSIKNGRVQHYPSSRIQIGATDAVIENASFIGMSSSTTGNVYAIDCNGTTSFSAENADFDKVRVGVRLMNAPAGTTYTIDGGKYGNNKNGIVIQSAQKVHISNVEIYGGLKFGISAVTLNELKLEMCDIHDNNYERGVRLTNVRDFIMSGGYVRDNKWGVYGYHSNITLRNSAEVSGNQYYGVDMWGSNNLLDSKLTLGDAGCARIINNGGNGVRSRNTTFDIDAIDHANANQYRPNRLDGNGGYAIHVCYQNATGNIPDEVSARGNYWGPSGPQYAQTFGTSTCGSFNDIQFVTTNHYPSATPPLGCIVYEPGGGAIEVRRRLAATTDELNGEEAVRLYPNPSTGTINIDVAEQSTVKVTDVQGRLVHSDKLQAGHNVLQLAGAGRGVHFVQITSENNTQTIRVVLND